MISEFVDRKAPTLLKMVLVVCVVNALLVTLDVVFAVLNHLHHGIGLVQTLCR